jgi:hypothetical protein
MNHFRDIANEALNPFEQTADGRGLVLAVEVLAAEVVVLGAIAQHLEGGGEGRSWPRR